MGNKDVLWNCYGAVFFDLFVGIVSSAVKIFQCYRHPNGQASVRSMPHVLCFEHDWITTATLAIITIVVFCILPLALVAFVLHIAPRRFHEPSFQTRWKFLVMKFQPSRRWWALAVLLKGLLANFTAILFHSASDQCFAFLFLSVLYLCGISIQMPWRSKFCSILDITTSAWLVLVTGYCLRFLVESSKSDEIAIILFSAVPVIVFMTLCVAVLRIYVQSRELSSCGTAKGMEVVEEVPQQTRIVESPERGDLEDEPRFPVLLPPTSMLVPKVSPSDLDVCPEVCIVISSDEAAEDDTFVCGI